MRASDFARRQKAAIRNKLSLMGGTYGSRERALSTNSACKAERSPGVEVVGLLLQSDLRHFYPSLSKGVRPFHGEAGFADLRRIRWGDAGELRTNVVDDVEVAVRPVV